MSEAKKRAESYFAQNKANGERHLIRLPEGASSVIDLVRYGMSLYPSSSESAAKAVHLNRDTFSLTRKLLLLRARQIMSREEDAIADKALAILDKDRRLGPARDIAKPILDKYWANNTHHGEYRARFMPQTMARKKAQKVFENTVFAIREACTNNDELEIPTMSRQEKEEAVATLSQCIGSLSVLKNRIMGDKT